MRLASSLPASAPLALRLRNFAASATAVALACGIYALAPYNRAQIEGIFGPIGFTFTGLEFLLSSAAFYTVLLGAYYLSQRDPRVSKSLRTLRVLASFVRSPLSHAQRDLAYADRVAVLTIVLKSFFAPLMLMSLMVFCMRTLENGFAIAASGAFSRGLLALFDQHGYWFLLQLILFIDVLVFTVGYLVELPSLGNEIRSVDPTLLGWAAALVCYPPFNLVSAAILGWQVNDFPRFDDPTAHVVLNFALLALMALYTSASIALGFKGSNLTHRGIVSRGPYAVVRHPAYVCKNLAWWIGSIPVVSTAFGQSMLSGVQAVASVAGWSMIYVLRALTEEDHLRRVDGEYARYADKVRNRFIPGVV